MSLNHELETKLCNGLDIITNILCVSENSINIDYLANHMAHIEDIFNSIITVSKLILSSRTLKDKTYSKGSDQNNSDPIFIGNNSPLFDRDYKFITDLAVSFPKIDKSNTDPSIRVRVNDPPANKDNIMSIVFPRIKSSHNESINDNRSHQLNSMLEFRPFNSIESQTNNIPVSLITQNNIINPNHILARNNGCVNRFLAVWYSMHQDSFYSLRNNRTQHASRLIYNFSKLTHVKNTKYVCSIYVIEYENMIPNLYGLVRYYDENIKKRKNTVHDKYLGKNKFYDETSESISEVDGSEALSMLIKSRDINDWIESMSQKGQVIGDIDQIRQGWDNL